MVNSWEHMQKMVNTGGGGKSQSMNKSSAPPDAHASASPQQTAAQLGAAAAAQFALNAASAQIAEKFIMGAAAGGAPATGDGAAGLSANANRGDWEPGDNITDIPYTSI